MGKALQVISGFVTAPTTSFQQVTPSGTDTFAVQNYYQGAQAVMINAWADLDTVGSVQFKSPNFHDNVNGINQEVQVTAPIPLFPRQMQQTLQANDTIEASLLDNGAGAPSGLTVLWYYDNLPGADANLFRYGDIQNSIVDYMSCAVTCAATGTPHGSYVGAAVLNSTQDQFKASTNYALLGYTANKQYQTVGVTGPDTSNRRVGGPGSTVAIYDTRDWFVRTSLESGLPTIPVLNSQNVSATIVDVVDTQNLGTGIITFFFARLNTPGR